jgi:hypothetical protein
VRICRARQPACGYRGYWWAWSAEALVATRNPKYHNDGPPAWPNRGEPALSSPTNVTSDSLRKRNPTSD